MKAKLLRRLRRKAYNKYGIVSFINNRNEEIYNVGYRSEITPDYACKAFSEHSYEDAVNRLNLLRRNYIISYVETRIKARNRDRKNERLWKL